MATDRQLAEDFMRLRPQHTSDAATHRALMLRYELTSEPSVRSRVYRGLRQIAQPAPALTLVDKPADKVVAVIRPQIVDDEPLETLDDLNDTAKWRATIDNMTARKRFVTVIHVSDVHFPYHDETALELMYKLIALVQPDVIVRGSDEDDNPTISHWAIDEGDTVPDIDDFLRVMRVHRKRHSKRLRAAAPHAVQVNIEGNHGYPRFKKWINKRARESAYTLTREYIQNVRCDGDVLFIGFKSSIRIGQLVVMHGKKYGTTAAKQTLELRANAVSIIAGHSHKPQSFSTVGDRPVTCVINGCLCLIPAHYADDEEDNYSNWQHGTAIATVDMKTGIADVKEIRFHKSDNTMWFEWGGRVYEIDTATAANSASAAA